MFISYANSDREVAKVLEDMLVRKDYSVWTPQEKLKLDDLWESQISDAILRCAYKGFFVILISEASVRSKYVEKELAFATSQGALIVPIIIGNPNITPELRNWLGNRKCERVSESPKEEELRHIIEGFDSVVKKKIANMNSGHIGGEENV